MTPSTRNMAGAIQMAEGSAALISSPA